MSKELIHHFAEEISHLHGNPNCKTCYGRFWTGISELPNGAKMLVKCHCVMNLGPTEYARLQARIDELQTRADERHAALMEELYGWIRGQSWLYRLRRWWRNRKATTIKGSDLAFIAERGQKRREGRTL